jgi:hypothetical protein
MATHPEHGNRPDRSHKVQPTSAVVISLYMFG